MRHYGVGRMEMKPDRIGRETYPRQTTGEIEALKADERECDGGRGVCQSW